MLVKSADIGTGLRLVGHVALINAQHDDRIKKDRSHHRQTDIIGGLELLLQVPWGIWATDKILNQHY